MINLSRREFTVTVGVASMLLSMTGMSVARDITDPNPLTLEQSLQLALRNIGTPGCIAAADKLDQSNSAPSPISIHLRSAGIDEDGAARISRALRAHKTAFLQPEP